MKVTDSEKHTSLLWYGIDMCFKKFYETDLVNKAVKRIWGKLTQSSCKLDRF